MAKNFMNMPAILKLLTLGFLVVLFFLVKTAIGGQLIIVFNREIPVHQWWSRGFGTINCVVALFLVAADILMLRRSRYGRPIYVASWVIMSLGLSYCVYQLKLNSVSARSSVIGNWVLTVIIGVYLYTGTGVKNYFRTSQR
jgi:hypothetical protein